MPKVSVLMITYNHEKFIEQAVRGVMMQETNFEYELVIGEDYSTDRTREIVVRLKEEFPNKIRLILHPQNVGMIPNMVSVYESCQGEYIALCEGDDYWTDPYKLQKQVDYMEAHPEHAMCFHWASVLDQSSGTFTDGWRIGSPHVQAHYTLNDLLTHNNFLPTCSVMFKNGLLPEYPEWFLKVPYGDIALHVLHAHYGTIGFIDQEMAVYRKHSGGVYSSASVLQQQQRDIATWEILGKHLHLAQYASYRNRFAIDCLWFNVHSGLHYCQQGEYIKASRALYKALVFCPASSRKVVVYTILSSFPPLTPWLEMWHTRYHHT